MDRSTFRFHFCSNTGSARLKMIRLSTKGHRTPYRSRNAPSVALVAKIASDAARRRAWVRGPPATAPTMKSASTLT